MQTLLQIDIDQFDSLLLIASEWLPNSLVVYHWLKIASSRMAPLLENALCYVDRFPDPTCICCIDPITYEGLNDSYFLSYAMKDDRDRNRFLNFLRSIDTKLRFSTDAQAICGLSLPIGLIDSYCDYFRQQKCSVKYYENDTYWVPPQFHKSLLRTKIEVPKNYYFDTLRLDEAVEVDRTWPHRWLGSLPLNIRKIKYMPNVCLRRFDDDLLASFEIMHSEFGLINHLYTPPKFRRQGLAKVVETRQMQKAIDAGMIPYKLVVRDNEAPSKMTEQIPFWHKYGEYPFVEIFTEDGRKLLEANTIMTSSSCSDGSGGDSSE